MAQAVEFSSLTQWSRRLFAAVMLTGQVVIHLISRPIHRRNTLDQMVAVGPESLVIALLTASFVGMVFTIQVTREFINFGAGTAVGGVLALTLVRELAPVLTAVVLAGRVGSAFAAEIGTMKVTEQLYSNRGKKPFRPMRRLDIKVGCCHFTLFSITVVQGLRLNSESCWNCDHF